MSGNRVGGDVDAFCTKCRMILGHTVLAMVGDKIARVRCNTCQGEHAYKGGPPGATGKTGAARASGGGRSAPIPKTAREKAVERPFEELFAGKDASAQKPYAPKTRFAEGDVLSHPTFGLGLVQASRHDKIDVAFKSGVKTLVHGLGEGGKTAVSFQKPKRPEPSSGAADKPPPGQEGLHVVHSAPPTELPRPPEAEPAASDEPQ